MSDGDTHDESNRDRGGAVSLARLVAGRRAAPGTGQRVRLPHDGHAAHDRRRSGRSLLAIGIAASGLLGAGALWQATAGAGQRATALRRRLSVRGRRRAGPAGQCAQGPASGHSRRRRILRRVAGTVSPHRAGRRGFVPHGGQLRQRLSRRLLAQDVSRPGEARAPMEPAMAPCHAYARGGVERGDGDSAKGIGRRAARPGFRLAREGGAQLRIRGSCHVAAQPIQRIRRADLRRLPDLRRPQPAGQRQLRGPGSTARAGPPVGRSPTTTRKARASSGSATATRRRASTVFVTRRPRPRCGSLNSGRPR